MNHNEAAAFINSQVACALIEVESMKAANTERESQGYALAYDEEAFMAIIDKYGIDHNAVLTVLREAQP